jgi:hypothetical protein
MSRWPARQVYIEPSDKEKFRKQNSLEGYNETKESYKRFFDTTTYKPSYDVSGIVKDYKTDGILPKRALYEIRKDVAKQKALWIPGYPHVGPFNKIQKAGSNALDEIARQHDIDYEHARTINDVRKADNKFLRELNLLQTEGAYEAGVRYISQLGIATKVQVERLLGKTLYPTNMKNDTQDIGLYDKDLEIGYSYEPDLFSKYQVFCFEGSN